MNKVKKTNFTDRIRNAWAALRAKPAKTLTIGIETRHCDKCDYYKAAHEPAQIGQEPPKTKYYYEIDYQEDRVRMRFCEATKDGAVEIASGYGFIRCEGAAGVAQATSYAMSRIWAQIGGGSSRATPKR